MQCKWSYHSWNLVDSMIIGVIGAYYHCIFCEWALLNKCVIVMPALVSLYIR